MRMRWLHVTAPPPAEEGLGLGVSDSSPRIQTGSLNVSPTAQMLRLARVYTNTRTFRIRTELDVSDDP